MRRTVFKNICDPNRAFVLDNDRWMNHQGDSVLPDARQFDTYGDNLTQHSGEYLVWWDQAGEFLISLAEWLQSASREEIADIIDCFPRYGISREAVEFYQKIKWREDKTQYFNKDERKVSTADSKRHDKRWMKVEEWMDGSFEALFRLITPEYYQDFYNLFKIWYELSVMLREGDGWRIWSIPNFTEYFSQRITLKDPWTELELYQAFDACRSVFRAHREIKASASQLRAAKRNIGMEIKEEAA